MTAKRQLVGEVVALIVELQDATQAVDEAAADHLGVNLTDLRCLRLVLQDGATTATDLAHATGLTRPAITFAIDRLEKAGLAARTSDPTDRRRILVEPTQTARRKVSSLWGPIESAGAEALSRYPANELRILADFLRKATKLQDEHALRIRGSDERKAAG
ncbi:MAG TPA: MarR family transcriptional regulator [Acidimicrobiia bacterium]|nr:MarR family transcriptional regulator [Acidimicrobiia bacterium]